MEPTLAWGADGASRTRKRRVDRRDRLAGIVRAELLPRLLANPLARRAPTVLPADPDALARGVVVAGDYDAARMAIAARLRSGATLPSVMQDDFAAAARRLGDYWREDACDFVAVTLATRALGDVLRGFLPEITPLKAALSLLISPAPGEAHLFGAEIVANLFGLAGWRAICCEADRARARLAREAFDVAAFSLSCDRHLDGLSLAIRDARAVSRHRRIRILVGGPAFAARPELAERLGADYCASEYDMRLQFPHAILQALRL